MDNSELDAGVESDRRDLARSLATWLRDAKPLKRWFSDEASYDDQDQSDLQPPRSVMMMITTYFYDDHDGDAYQMLIASQRETPLWPHACIGGPDACAACSNIGGSCGIGYEYAMTAYSPEPNPPHALNETFRPFAIARRADDGEISVEIMTPATRGWHDLPVASSPWRAVPVSAVPLLRGDRAVLGDALIEAGDPRGELIAHAMRGLDCEALIAAHGRTWLGSLDALVPRSGIRWRDGVPDQIFVCGDVDVDDDQILPWRLGPRVHLLGESTLVWGPEMRHLRGLGVVDDAVLGQIREPTAIEHLEIYGGSELPRALFPRLRTLVIHTSATSFELPDGVDVELAWLHGGDDAHAAWLAAWSASGARVVCSMHEEYHRAACGWTFDLRDEVVAISHRGFHEHADLQRLAALRRALGGRPSRDVASATWNGLF